MGLSYKSHYFMLIAILLVILNLAVYAGTKLIISDSFEKLEQTAVETNTRRAVNALENDLDALGTLCSDWAIWNDSYEFVVNVNPEYIVSNLSDSTFASAKLNTILFFNAKGDLVFSKAFDLAEAKEVKTPAELISQLLRYLEHPPPGRDAAKSDGIFFLTDAPMLVSLRPILTSDGEGPTEGTLVMARWFSEEVIAQISKRTALQLSMEKYSESVASENETAALVDPAEPDVIWGRQTIKDINGAPASVLSVKMKRDVFLQGQKTINYFLRGFFLISLLIGGILYLLSIKYKEKYTASEWRFRYVFEHTTDGLFVVEPGGEINLINPAARRLLNLPDSRPNWDSITRILGDGPARELRQEVLTAHSMGSADRHSIGDFQFETRLQNSENKDTHVIISFHLPEKQHSSWGIPVSIVDITERKQSEELLRESQEKFKAVADTSPLAIYMSVGMEQKAEYINPTFTRLFGYSADEVPMMSHWWSLAYPDENYRREVSGDWQKRVANAIETKSVIEPMEVVVTCKDGSKKDISWGFITIGKQNWAFGLDLTERKKAEEVRTQLNIQLEAKNKELERFVYVTSHDLRAPLISIEGFSGILDASVETILSILDKSGLSSETKSYLASVVDDSREARTYIRNGVTKMTTLLKGLSQVSQAGRAVIRRAKLDMNQFISHLLNEFEFQRQKQGARIEISELPSCLGDAEQLNQLFCNLIDNALKYSVPDRPAVIKIYGVREADRAVYTVEDNGVGIAPKDHQKVFVMFHQLDPEKAGEGLGLNIVLKIAERHNGRVWVESEVGRGSRFKVSLPVA